MSFQLTKTVRPISNFTLWMHCNCRSYATRSKCGPHDDPKCSKETLAKQKPCPSKLRRLEAKEDYPKIGIWEDPECCRDPCPNYYPRFDELYYASTDKGKRKYQQTWISCPQLQIKRKTLCIQEELKLPPIERRNVKRKPLTACPVGGPRICMNNKSRKCPKAMVPGCRVGRMPPKCKSERLPMNCMKECAPYPSYSECLRKEKDALHPEECKCLNHPMMCEVWAEMRRRMTFVKG